MKSIVAVLLTICVMLALGMTHLGGTDTYRMDATEDNLFVMDTRTGVVKVFPTHEVKEGAFHTFPTNERIQRNWKQTRARN